jgi:DNA ligase-1
MKRFAGLYWRLDATTRTSEKVSALVDYFREAPEGDAAWAVFFLSGNRLKQLLPARVLRQWAMREASLPEWLFEECYERVGDLAETVALVLPAVEQRRAWSLREFAEQRLESLRGLDEEKLVGELRLLPAELAADERLLAFKLLTGAFRVGVSQTLVLRALSQVTGVEVEVLAGRLMGTWTPSADAYRALVDGARGEAGKERPYPFCLAHPLQRAPEEELVDLSRWQVEWKWDGIRAQVLRRDGATRIWSRGEELINDAFPEVVDACGRIPEGTVLDGELLAWDERANAPLPFLQLQRRLGRKSPGKKLLQEVPARLLCFDLLEFAARDIREMPLAARYERLSALVAATEDPRLRLAPRLPAESWATLAALRAASREHRAEGLMLKDLTSAYRVGRPRGIWWKWKIDPMTVDAVLVYAQAGSGRRASLFTDYTFAVWKGEELVPIAKAYSGLTDEEIAQVDAFVKRNTLERFGPVRQVSPELVFELAFENIQRSTRHKSGVAVRFPRIVRWRHDKRPADADHLEQLLARIDAER